MHIGRKFWSPHFCWSYVPWNLENTYKWPCHCNSSETTDPFIMKLGMYVEHHMVLCILAGNFDRLIFVGVSPWNIENIRESTNNLSFLCQFFINEITASDAGPDIIRSHLFWLSVHCYNNTCSLYLDIIINNIKKFCIR